MKIKLLTKINACIALLLGALGISGCGNIEAKYGSPEALYGPPVEDLYGVPLDDSIFDDPVDTVEETETSVTLQPA